MRRLTVLLFMLLVPALPAHAQNISASTVTFNDASDTISVSLGPRKCAVVSVDAGTLTATFIATASLDGGVTYSSDGAALTAMFVAPTKGTTGTSFSVTDPNDATSRSILVPAGATDVKVSLSAYTSGSATVRLRAIPDCAPAVLYGSDGNNLRAVPVLNSSPAADAYGIPVRFIGSSLGGTSMTDDAAFTPGTSAVTPIAGTYRSVRDAVDDGDAGALAMTAKRGLYVALETPNGDSAMDDTLDAAQVTIMSTVTNGGQSATSTTSPYPNCLTTKYFSTASNAAATAVAGSGAKSTYVCSYAIVAGGTTNVDWVYGDDANCATNQTQLGALWRMNTTSFPGISRSSGPSPVIVAPAGKYLCIKNSATVQIDVEYNYAQF